MERTIMSTPPLGMMTVPHWEWWLHHNPFRRSYGEGGRSSCPICESDTGCYGDCPRVEIELKFEEIVALMRAWNGRHDAPTKPKCNPMGVDGLGGHFWNENGSGCLCGAMKVKGGIVYLGDPK